MHLVVHPGLNADGRSFSYVLVNPASQRCAIVDPMLEYDPELDQVTTDTADRIIEFVSANALIVEWILETRLHTGHLSAARYLKFAFVCAQIGIGSRVTEARAQLAHIILFLFVPTQNSDLRKPGRANSLKNSISERTCQFSQNSCFHLLGHCRHHYLLFPDVHI